MGAICGIVNFDGKPVREAEVRRLIGAMKYYGRDCQNISVDGCVGFAGSQLHCAPKSLRQPQDNHHWIAVCDARIDNRDELLQLLSPCQTNPTDCDLILLAFRRWGVLCPARLFGDFAFAIWDPASRALFAVRDHLGIRPLFYACQSNSLVFSSSLASIVVATSRREIDDYALADLLLRASSFPERTLYREVHRVPGGHALLANLHQAKISQHWTAPCSESRARSVSDQEAETRTLLVNAVRRRVRGDAAVGVSMSGGLDSGGVAAIAARQLAARGRTVTAFVAVPTEGFGAIEAGGRLLDESDQARMVCHAIPSLRLQIVSADGVCPANGLDEELEAFERPIPNAINRYWLLAIHERARDAGIRVMLTGLAGNYTFSWIARQLSLRSIVYRAIRLVRMALPPWLRGGRPAEPESWDAVAPLGRRLAPLRTEVIAHSHHWMRLPSRLTRFYFLGRGSAHDQYAAIGARFGMEIRDPTADRQLAEHCLALPETAYVARSLARESLRGIVPDRRLADRRRGLQAADALFRMRGQWASLRSYMLRLRRNDLVADRLDLEAIVRASYRLEAADPMDLSCRPILGAILLAQSVAHFLTTVNP